RGVETDRRPLRQAGQGASWRGRGVSPRRSRRAAVADSIPGARDDDPAHVRSDGIAAVGPAGDSLNIARALEKLDAWIEGQQFRGWDPHDALNSPLLRALTFGNRYLGIATLQAV